MEDTDQGGTGDRRSVKQRDEGQRLGKQRQERATEVRRETTESKDRRKRDCRDRREQIVLRQGQKRGETGKRLSGLGTEDREKRDG